MVSISASLPFISMEDILSLDTAVASIATRCDPKSFSSFLLVSRKVHQVFKKNGWAPSLPQALWAIEQRPRVYCSLHPGLRMTKAVLIHGVRLDPALIFDLPSSIQNDANYCSLMNLLKKIAFLAAKAKGDEALCERLVNEEQGIEPVLKSFREKTHSISVEMLNRQYEPYAPLSPLFEDPEVASVLIHVRPQLLHILLEGFDSLSKNQEVMLASVEEDGRVIRFASGELLQKRPLVSAAVEQNGFALGYLDAVFKDDKDVVLQAVLNDRGLTTPCLSGSPDGLTHLTALQFASDRLRKDWEVVAAAVHTNGFSLFWALEPLHHHKAFVLNAVYQDPRVFLRLDEPLKSDREIRLAVIKRCCELYIAKKRRETPLSMPL